jgi:hypothetical protein
MLELSAPKSITLAKREQTQPSFITIIFSKSPSRSFQDAVLIAKGADSFRTETIEAKTFYIANYSNNRVSCLKAKMLMEYCNSWRGTINLVNGLPTKTLFNVLECYTKATACTNHKAHCYAEAHLDDDVQYSTSRALVSCKLAGQGYAFFEKHPASLEDQLQAYAVRKGTDICPLFKPEVIKWADR